MHRLIAAVAIAFLFPLAVKAAACNLQMTISCQPLRPGATSRCSATTMNSGAQACTGLYITGYFVEAALNQAALSSYNSGIGLTECFDAAQLGGEEPFVLCFGPASLPGGARFTQTVNITLPQGAPSTLPIIAITYVADENFNELAFVYAFANFDLPTCTPTIGAPPVSQSGLDYTVNWTATLDANATYILDESTKSNFSSDVTTQTVSGLSKPFRHDVVNTTTYYYRVRATTCGGSAGSYSQTAAVVVQAPPPAQSKSSDTIVPFGSTSLVRIPIFIPPPAGKGALDTGFTATTDKSYLTVTPSSGTIPPGGTTVTVTANPKDLPPGANTGTLNVTTTGGAAIANVPVSVSLVTPVASGGKSGPPQNALIIPIVTHVNSAGGPFLSDVRLTNVIASAVNYQVSFTPTRSDGTQSGKKTSVTVQPGQTIALNDIAKDFFGFGATNDPNDTGFGALEIRPLNTSTLLSFASSRTYLNTGGGTFGQFIAAVPFSDFATKVPPVPLPGVPTKPPATVLSLQQIAESTKWRTNLGVVEGSGAAANFRIIAYDDNGNVRGQKAYTFLPGEHRQMNRFLSTELGISSLDDGRIEIVVDSSTGALTAYASVLDNITSDPFAVMPAQPAAISATRYVLPGIADFSSAVSNFHSDVRIYNGGTLPATVTATFYPQGNATPKAAAPITIGKGEVKAFNNILPTLFSLPNGGGGSVVLTTPSSSSLVATANTYSIRSDGGTFGQFIPGVSPAQGIGAGDRPLQMLQLEQSQNFRSNLGIAELTGNPVKVRVTLILPDSKASPLFERDLQANEFIQFTRVIEMMLGPGTNVYNARVTVEVVSGSGRVTAYASVVDNATADPTYVPAQ